MREPCNYGLNITPEFAALSLRKHREFGILCHNIHVLNRLPDLSEPEFWWNVPEFCPDAEFLPSPVFLARKFKHFADQGLAEVYVLLLHALNTLSKFDVMAVSLCPQQDSKRSCHLETAHASDPATNGFINAHR